VGNEAMIGIYEVTKNQYGIKVGRKVTWQHNALKISNTFSKHKDNHNYTWANEGC
jgi:predicted RecA/RadA family phage recombinase